MVNPRLETFIRDRLAAGMTEQQITDELINAGWPSDAVAEGMQEVASTPATANPTPVTTSAARSGAHVTGLSGNELFCLDDLGFQAGNIGVGNSVHSLGISRSLGSSFRGLVGGEVKALTELMVEGRTAALKRLEAEVEQQGATGVTGVTTEIIATGGRLEFLSVGSLLHGGKNDQQSFSSSADGQELYCQIDAGYEPRRFVFGNVAYSIGVGRNIMGSLRTLVRGEVTEYTEVFNRTRQLSLERIVAEAKQAGANSVVNIRAQIIPFSGGYGAQEMILIGTASHNPDLPAEYTSAPVTSDLTNQEMWGLAKKGYHPLKLLIGTSVYSLGFVGGITSSLKSFTHGEIPELTKLIYEAREKALGKVEAEANALGADDVMGTKFYLYELGSGLIEVMAIGTAVKKSDVAKTHTDALPAQAIIHDKDTFVDRTIGWGAANLSRQSARVGGFGGLLTSLIIFLFGFLYVIITISSAFHSSH